MSIGLSGRIVIELDPLFKRQIYSALAQDGLTLKEWFIERAEEYVQESNQDSTIEQNLSS